MKNKKMILRCLCVILTVVLCLGMVPSAFAAGTMQISFGQITAKSGEEITLPVTVSDNDGIAAFRFRVSYDADALTFLSVEEGAALSAGTLVLSADDAKQTVTFLWYATEDVRGDGVIAEMKFKVSATAEGEYPISVYYLAEDILNEDKEQIDCSVVDGVINVELTCQHENTTAVPARASTCLVQGNAAYTKCDDCGEVILGDDALLPLAECGGGKATCEEKAVCAVCGKPYGELADHVLTKHEKVEADHNTAGSIEYWSCDECGKCFSDESAAEEITKEDTVIQKLPHDVIENWETDAEKHWQTCSCGDRVNEAAHDFGDGDTCLVCGYRDFSWLMGDVDFSGKIDVADIVKLKSCIMTEQWSDAELAVGDMDNSGRLDVGDIMAIKNIIMAS